MSERKRGRSLLVWGCGGHGRVVLDAARASGDFERVAFGDDDASLGGATICGAEVIRGGLAGALDRGFCEFVVGVGRNDLRAACLARGLEAGLRAAVCLHPRAWVSPFATIGAGSVVLAQAVVQNGAVVGGNCIVNTAAVVEHDVRIGDHAHVSPGALLGGGAAVGGGAHVGAGAVVLPGVRVGDRAMVGAGALVRTEVRSGTTVVGVPARILARFE